MKKITNLLIFITISSGFSQSLPLDFEVSEDDTFNPFNGATASVVIDPTNAANNVLELTSNGADFDGASINLDTYIDLSDDSNNIITLEFWAPDATPRTHLLKLEGGGAPAPATELYFSTTVAGWQTISLNFGTNLSSNYPILVIFADSGVGNTATGTYYIDDIDGPNGDVIPQDPTPTNAAPIPDTPNSEVYSIYNDTNGYTTTFPVQYSFGTLAGEPDLDPSAAVNRALKYNFGVAGWGQGEGGPDDVSAYNYLIFYYWAGDGLNGFNVVMINNGAEFVYQIGVDEAIITESWVKVEIPISYFTNIGFDDTAFFQWKIGPLSNSVDNAGIAYIDNILLTFNTLSTEEFELSEILIYPNPSNSDWNIRTNDNIIDLVQIFDVLGKEVFIMSPNSSEVKIDTSDLPNGQYLARVSTYKGSKIFKLLKK